MHLLCLPRYRGSLTLMFAEVIWRSCVRVDINKTTCLLNIIYNNWLNSFCSSITTLKPFYIKCKLSRRQNAGVCCKLYFMPRENQHSCRWIKCWLWWGLCTEFALIPNVRNFSQAHMINPYALSLDFSQSTFLRKTLSCSQALHSLCGFTASHNEQMGLVSSQVIIGKTWVKYKVICECVVGKIKIK